MKGGVGIKAIKLIALDLDGTLLRKDKTIGPATKQLLHDLHRRGIAITIATGRMYHFSQHVQDLLGFPLNFICTDGAYLRPASADRPVFGRSRRRSLKPCYIPPRRVGCALSGQ